MAKITHDDITRQFHLLKTNPQAFLDLTDRLVKQDTSDATSYFSRHQAWHQLGRLDMALADLNSSLHLERHATTYQARGDLYRELGQYQLAIDDYNRAEALAPDNWPYCLGPLYRADCHARLGNETAAVADAETLPDFHWTPGMSGTPAGSREDVIPELRRRAAARNR
ncbi:MAG TPA: tetratricopeptide repeat protein [Candidatus Cybelea sp.]|nr:tetratricopeptide repeat protein [Candidatus Cybelea sp.]